MGDSVGLRVAAARQERNGSRRAIGMLGWPLIERDGCVAQVVLEDVPGLLLVVGLLAVPLDILFVLVPGPSLANPELLGGLHVTIR